MTAYVNDEQKKEGAYGKAVKATLAATLAAGMVPAAAAFAQPADEAAVEGGVELLGLSNAEAWNGGVFTAVDNSGAAVAIEKNFAGTHYVAEKAFTDDGTLHKVVPAKVVLANGAGELDLTDKEKFDVSYHKDSKGGTVATDDDMKQAGTFFMVVKPTAANTDWAGCEFAVEFKIAADVASIDGAELYQVSKDAKDLTDKEFVYAGAKIAAGNAEGNLNVVVDGKALKQGTDYTAKFYARNDNSKEIEVKDAGAYTAVITGTGAYAGTKSIDFEVQKLDLSKATFEFDTADFAVPVLQKVNGAADFDGVAFEKLFKVSVVKPAIANGEYKYTISLNTELDPNESGQEDANKKAIAVQKNFVEGVSGVYTAVKADNTLALSNILYGGKAAAGSYTIEPGDDVFDLKKISVKHGGNVLASKYYTVEVLDKKGNVVDDSKIAETGVWTVRVTANAAETGWALGGSVDITVDVQTAQIASNDVVWKFDGSLIDATKGKAVDYDGTDALEKLDVTVSFGGKQLVEGTDYKMTVTNEAGEEVEKAVEAGKYTVALSSDAYTFEDTEALKLEVKAVTANNYRIAPESRLHGDEKAAEIAYTGEAIAPVVQYETAEKDADGDSVWKDLPAGSYTLSFEYAKKLNSAGNDLEGGKKADAMKELGFYKVTVADANLKDSLTLNSVAMTDLYKVVEGKVFADVKPGDWFYDYVYAASQSDVEYMQGIGNSDIFAPNQTTTRAMAATVLSRMAVLKGAQPDDYTNPFTDVDYTGIPALDPWYANAVLWASETGIVTGYPGTTEFRPDAEVTRAEFCVMMQRYAAATGQGKALEAGEADEILAKYEDGASVPAWCKDAVAWAVKNEVFGGYSVLNPDGDITRAEMAKMAVAFQAKPLK